MNSLHLLVHLVCFLRIYFRYELKFYFSLINSWRYWTREKQKARKREPITFDSISFSTPRPRVESIHRMLMEFWHWLGRKHWSFGIGFSFATLIQRHNSVTLRQATNYREKWSYVSSIDMVFASESFCHSFGVLSIECVSSAGRHQAVYRTVLTSNYIFEYKAITINFHNRYVRSCCGVLWMYSPDGSSFNNDDHACRIWLIKWQWGGIASYTK